MQPDAAWTAIWLPDRQLFRPFDLSDQLTLLLIDAFDNVDLASIWPVRSL